ncbi:hypothetical protein Hanom_Chr00s000002g01600961 [Helianthus anomalus]
MSSIFSQHKNKKGNRGGGTLPRNPLNKRTTVVSSAAAVSGGAILDLPSLTLSLRFLAVEVG